MQAMCFPGAPSSNQLAASGGFRIGKSRHAARRHEAAAIPYKDDSCPDGPPRIRRYKGQSEAASLCY